MRAPKKKSSGVLSRDEYFLDSSQDSPQGLVLDCGSGMCKAGFAGDDAPRAVFPLIVGRPKRPGIIVGTDYKDAYIADEAQSKRGVLTLKYPIEHGIVIHWDDAERIWHHTFYNELRVAPEEHPVLLTEPALTPTFQRERIAEIMFEKFNVPGLFFAEAEPLALLASGKISGTILASGHGVTTSAAIVDGTARLDSISRLNVGGSELSLFLMESLMANRVGICTTGDLEIVRDMKEKLCRIPLNYDTELKKMNSGEGTKLYEMPDGTVVQLGSELITVPEAIFTPSLIDVMGLKGVQHLVHNTISRCAANLRNMLSANVVAVGGNTMFEGFEARLNQELSTLIEGNMIHTRFPPERKYSVWIGGSIFASQYEMTSRWLTLENYAESGKNIVYRQQRLVA